MPTGLICIALNKAVKSWVCGTLSHPCQPTARVQGGVTHSRGEVHAETIRQMKTRPSVSPCIAQVMDIMDLFPHEKCGCFKFTGAVTHFGNKNFSRNAEKSSQKHTTQKYTSLLRHGMYFPLNNRSSDQALVPCSWSHILAFRKYQN